MSRIRIYGDTSGHIDIKAPDEAGNTEVVIPEGGFAGLDSPTFTGNVDLPVTTDYNGEQLSTTLASKLPYSYGTATPSTTVDGFLWYDENDTPPTPKFWDGAAFQNVAPAGGLEFITSESFSAVSSVSLNGCFSGDYENYLLVGSGIDGSSNANRQVQFRLRSSGTDRTANYSWGIVGRNTFSASTLSTGANNTNLAVLIDNVYYTSTDASFALTVTTPFDSGKKTTLHGSGVGLTSGEIITQSIGVSHDTASGNDGFSLISSATNFSGTIRVYGYKD